MDWQRFGDEQLMTLVSQQEAQALSALYDRHARSVYSLAVRMLSDRDVASEVTQEVFLNVWQRASSFNADRGKFQTWLLSITHHRCIDEIRRRRRAQTQPFGSSYQEDRILTDSEASSQDKTFWQQMEEHAIKNAMRDLPPPQQQVISMAYFQGLTQAEIAGRLGAPLGTVKTRMRLGLQKLREALADKDPGNEL